VLCFLVCVCVFVCGVGVCLCVVAGTCFSESKASM